jgi:hypothetical protein
MEDWETEGPMSLDDEYVWLADLTHDQATTASRQLTKILNDRFTGEWIAQFSSFRFGEHIFSRDGVVAKMRVHYSLTKKELWECIHVLVPEEELERIAAEDVQYAGMMHLIESQA